jgi:hypothetical protein
MDELQPVGLSPLARMRITTSFKSAFEGDAEGNHLNAFLYQSIVAVETFRRYCRSRRNSVKHIALSPTQVLRIRRKCAKSFEVLVSVGILVPNQVLYQAEPRPDEVE